MILIVSRGGEQTRSLVRYFRTFGVRADHAAGVPEALGYLEATLPRVLVLDHDLPGPMSGVDLLERLRGCDRTRSLDVVFYTDVADPECVGRAKRLGAVDWIVCAAPKSRQSLLRVVHGRVL